MTTGTVPVAPSTTLPKSRSSGATPNPVAVVVEPVDVPVDVAVAVGVAVGVSVGEVVGVAVGSAVALGACVWQRGRVSPVAHGFGVGLGVRAAVGSALGTELAVVGSTETAGDVVADGLIPKHPTRLRTQIGIRAIADLRDRKETERCTADSLSLSQKYGAPHKTRTDDF